MTSTPPENSPEMAHHHTHADDKFRHSEIHHTLLRISPTVWPYERTNDAHAWGNSAFHKIMSSTSTNSALASDFAYRTIIAEPPHKYTSEQKITIQGHLLSSRDWDGNVWLLVRIELPWNAASVCVFACLIYIEFVRLDKSEKHDVLKIFMDKRHMSDEKAWPRISDLISRERCPPPTKEENISTRRPGRKLQISWVMNHLDPSSLMMGTCWEMNRETERTWTSYADRTWQSKNVMIRRANC